MISTDNVRVDRDTILQYITEKEIIESYLNIRVPCKMRSPLRNDDNNPSFGFYFYKGTLFYKDFGTGKSGNVFDFLKEYWYCNDLHEVYRKVYKELVIPRIKHESKTVVKANTAKKNKENKKLNVKKSDIVVIPRSYEKHDLEYWNQFGITKKWLEIANVIPISHYIIGNTYYKAEKHAYAYLENKDDIITYKIYQPFSKHSKWKSNNDKSVISLWTKLPNKGNILVISSSLKDALCIYANADIPAIALQSEGTMMKTQIIEELKGRFKHIVILLDNDTAGINYSQRLAESTGFTNVVLPKSKHYKDVAEYYVHLNDKKLFKKNIREKILFELIQNNEIR
jgi:hypothetical protein